MKLFEMIQQIGSRAGTRAATALFFKVSLSHSRSAQTRQTDTHLTKGLLLFQSGAPCIYFRPVFVTNALKKAAAQLIFDQLQPRTRIKGMSRKMQSKSAVKFIVASHFTFVIALKNELISSTQLKFIDPKITIYIKNGIFSLV